MQLSTTSYSLPTTYIGDEELPEYVPVAPVQPEPNPEGGDPEPETPDTPTTQTGLTSAQKIQVSLGSILLVLFIVVLIMCYLTCKQGNAYTQRDSTVKEADAQALVYNQL